MLPQHGNDISRARRAPTKISVLNVGVAALSDGHSGVELLHPLAQVLLRSNIHMQLALK